MLISLRNESAIHLWQNLFVPVYLKVINEIARVPRYTGECKDENATGKSASFVCGSFVRFAMRIDLETKRIEDIRYKTNGCGFVVAAAETLADNFHNICLTDLHGMGQIAASITNDFDGFPYDREHCLNIVVEAFRESLANFRELCIEEFQGEKALICTCFGVTEETIVELIEKQNLTEVRQISTACNAGSGCGSCQMLIQELIDSFF